MRYSNARCFAAVVIAAIFNFASQAQTNLSTLGLPQVSPQNVPLLGGTFWSWQLRDNFPPTPYNPLPNAPLYALDTNIFIYDDSGFQPLMARGGLATSRGMMLLESEGPPPPPGGGTGGGGDPEPPEPWSPPNYSSNTLWLEITGVTTNGFADLLVHGTVPYTNYEILSRTALTNATWLSEGIITGAVGQSWTETQVPVGTRTNTLFFTARSWIDSDGDGMADWWELAHFGNLDQTASGDYDGDGADNLSEFQHATDPNTISFYTLFDNLWVSSNTATGMVQVINGMPSKIAILIDNTNTASATWVAYNPSFIASLGPIDETHQVYVGLKGMAMDSLDTWVGNKLTRDAAAPSVVITNPVSGTLFQSTLQLRGYSLEPLSSIRYDITNASGVLTNQDGYVVQQIVDTNTLQITTNFFQCVDVPLAIGTNRLTLQLTDRAGNITNLIREYIYVVPTNAPQLTLIWPQSGKIVCGTNFTLRALLSDSTASLTAEIIGGDGTNTVPGIVDRDGRVWVENLPLSAGTNSVTLVAVDAGANTVVTNLTVVQSTLALTITPPSPNVLYQPFIAVQGTIDSTNHAVWVNGVKATISEGGNWTAEEVPLNTEGAAVIEARAIPDSDNGGNGTGGGGRGAASFSDPGNPSSSQGQDVTITPDKPAQYFITHYDRTWEGVSMHDPLVDCTKLVGSEKVFWDLGKPGTVDTEQCNGWPCWDRFYYTWNKATYNEKEKGTFEYGPNPPGLTWACGDKSVAGGGDYTLIKNWRDEHCDVLGVRFVTGSLGDTWLELQNRTANALYTLRTGGKGGSRGKHRFEVQGSAQGAGNVFWPEKDPEKSAYPIAGTAITMGVFGKLDANGKARRNLQDNIECDITPRVEGRSYYTFHIDALDRSCAPVRIGFADQPMTPSRPAHVKGTLELVCNPGSDSYTTLDSITWEFDVDVSGNVTPKPIAGNGNLGDLQNITAVQAIVHQGPWAGIQVTAVYIGCPCEGATLNWVQTIVEDSNPPIGKVPPYVEGKNPPSPYYWGPGNGPEGIETWTRDY